MPAGVSQLGPGVNAVRWRESEDPAPGAGIGGPAGGRCVAPTCPRTHPIVSLTRAPINPLLPGTCARRCQHIGHSVPDRFTRRLPRLLRCNIKCVAATYMPKRTDAAASLQSRLCANSMEHTSLHPQVRARRALAQSTPSTQATHSGWAWQASSKDTATKAHPHSHAPR